MDAVDHTDVLKDNINYVVEGERFRQKAVAEAAGAIPPLQPPASSSAGITPRSASAPAVPPAAEAPDAGNSGGASAPAPGSNSMQPPLAVPLGDSGVSISKNLGRPPADPISQQVPLPSASEAKTFHVNAASFQIMRTEE